MAATSCYIPVKFISTLINVGLPEHAVFVASRERPCEGFLGVLKTKRCNFAAGGGGFRISMSVSNFAIGIVIFIRAAETRFRSLRKFVDVARGRESAVFADKRKLNGPNLATP